MPIMFLFLGLLIVTVSLTLITKERWNVWMETVDLLIIEARECNRAAQKLSTALSDGSEVSTVDMVNRLILLKEYQRDSTQALNKATAWQITSNMALGTVIFCWLLVSLTGLAMIF